MTVFDNEDVALAALEKDARRYRYLRDRVPAEVLGQVKSAAGCWIDSENEEGTLVLLTGDDADAAIDAAIDASKTACQKRVTFARGDRVRKRSGSAWEGIVVGEYSTSLTPEGYAVESLYHPGSVQIYPAPALEMVIPALAKE